MELKDYWAAMRAGWKILVATVLVALLIGGAVVIAKPNTSEQQFLSVRKVMLTVPGGGSSNKTYPESSLASRTLSYAELAAGTQLAERVAADLGEGTEVGIVSASAVPSTTVIQLSVSQSDEEQAKKVVDAYVRLLPEAIAEVNVAQDEGLQATLISSTDESIPAASSGTPRIMMLALILGLGLGVGAALLRYTASAQGTAPE